MQTLNGVKEWDIFKSILEMYRYYFIILGLQVVFCFLVLDVPVYSREIWWLEDGLDDSSIDGEDGENDTGQED